MEHLGILCGSSSGPPRYFRINKVWRETLVELKKVVGVTDFISKLVPVEDPKRRRLCVNPGHLAEKVF